MIFRQRAILAKIETTYGTDAVPTGAADALLVADDLDVKPMDNEMVERGVIQSYLGHAEMFPVATRIMITFKVEMVGSGAAGTAPAWGKLLKACAFSETISAGTSVAYAPAGTASSLSMYYFMDGVRHKILGARGSVKLKMTPRQVPYFEFSFTGLYGGVPTDTANPSLTLTAWKAPIAVNNANTSAFALHSYAGKLYDMDIDVANQVVYRNLVGTEDVQITDRQPAGSIEVEAVALATKDFWTIARTPTLSTLTLLHGTAAGYKVQIDAPLTQLINPEYTNRDQFTGLKMGTRFKPNAGNDELVITAL